MSVTTYTAALQEAYASAPPDVVVLDTIEIYHPTWASPFRLVRDRIPLTATLEATAPNNPSAAVTFSAADFALSLPRSGDGFQQLQLVIDNTGRDMMAALEAIDLSDATPIRCIYRPYLSTDLSAPHMSPVLTLAIRSITATLQSVTLSCGYADFANYRFPRKVYTSKQFPGLASRA